MNSNELLTYFLRGTSLDYLHFCFFEVSLEKAIYENDLKAINLLKEEAIKSKLVEANKWNSVFADAEKLLIFRRGKVSEELDLLIKTVSNIIQENGFKTS